MFTECYLSYRWFFIYFQYGIPIYRKRLSDRTSFLSEIDNSQLNSASESFVLNFVSPLVFKKNAEVQWMFRQKSFRTAVMHGKLFIDQEDNNIYLVSYINWWILLMAGIAIHISLKDKKLFFLIFVFITFMLYYFLEKKMYDRLIQYLSEGEL